MGSVEGRLGFGLIMQLGIFAKTFSRPSVEAVFDAVGGLGLGCCQFNFACAGLDSVPGSIPADLPARIGAAARQRRLRISAVSATFNMAHPAAEVRRHGLRGLDRLGAAARELDTKLLTLCTGTRDPGNMWRHHPGNASPGAWRDMVSTLHQALEIAERHDIQLALEPEANNVVATARDARRLLSEMAAPRLGLILDPANLVRPGDPSSLSAILEEALDLLGADLLMAHAKELAPDGRAGGLGLGQGLLPWNDYLARLRACAFEGPLIMHGFSETEAAASVRFLRGCLEQPGRQASAS